jgi:hypothetical protein
MESQGRCGEKVGSFSELLHSIDLGIHEINSLPLMEKFFPLFELRPKIQTAQRFKQSADSDSDFDRRNAE